MAKNGESISPREMDVLNAMRRGATNKEIAAELSISANTVKTHVRSLYAKLDASTRTEAILRATEQQLFEPLPTPPAPAIEAPVKPQAETSLPTNQTKMMPMAIGGALLAILLIGLTAWLIMRSPNGSESAVKESSFTPTQIGDTPWRTAPTLPSNRTGFALTSVGSDLYVIGGETGENVVSADGFTLNPRENVWRPLANKPTAVKHAPAAVILGQIIVPGGETVAGMTDTVEIYSPSENAWRTTSPLPQPMSGSVALAHNDTLYLFGGMLADETARPYSFAWEPETELWRPLPDMPDGGRAFATGGVVDDLLYIVGGIDSTKEPLPVCEKFDPATETWAECPWMQHSRAYASTTTILNKLYVIGGIGSPDGEQFTPETGWQSFPLPMFPNNSWYGNGTTTIETRLYTLGGVLDGEMTAAHYSWNALPYQYFIPSTLNE